MHFETLERRTLLALAHVVDVANLFNSGMLIDSGAAVGTAGPVRFVSGGTATNDVTQSGKDTVAGTLAGNVALAQFNSGGALNTAFSGDGIVTTDFGGSDVALNITPLADGKLVITGISSPAGGDWHFIVARYTADGNLDTTFASSGKLVTDIGPAPKIGSSIATLSDGSIVAIGGNAGVFAARHYSSAGTLDENFPQHLDDSTPLASAAAIIEPQSGQMLAHMASEGLVISGDESASEDQDFSLHIDASGVDRAIDSFAIDWGDGSDVQIVSADTTDVAHRFIAAGPCTVHVTAQLATLLLYGQYDNGFVLPDYGIVKAAALDIRAWAGGNLNVGTGAMILTNTSMTTLKYDIGSDGQGSVWSSNAYQSDWAMGLGFARAGDIGVSEFCGQPVNSSDILVKYTTNGDANLDGRSDYQDYDRFLAGYNGTASADWCNGDFDNSGSVTLGDYWTYMQGVGATGDDPIMQSGDAQWMDTESAAPITVNEVTPAAPSDVAINYANGVYTLSWTANSAIATGYTIDLTNEDDGTTTTLTAAPDATSMQLSLDDYTGYSVSVSANAGEDVQSDFSEPAYVNTSDNLPVDHAPTDVTAFQSEGDGLVVTWHDAANNETGYQVLVKSDGPDDDWEVWGTYGANTVMGSTHMPTGHRYDVQVIALGAHGDSDPVETSTYMHPLLVYDFEADHYETITGITASWLGSIGAQQTGGTLTLSLGELPAHYALRIDVGCIGNPSEGGIVTVTCAGSTMQLADNANGTMGQVMEATHTGGDATVTITGSGWSGGRTWKLDVVTILLLRYNIQVGAETMTAGDAEATEVPISVTDAHDQPVPNLALDVDDFDDSKLSIQETSVVTTALGTATLHVKGMAFGKSATTLKAPGGNKGTTTQSSFAPNIEMGDPVTVVGGRVKASATVTDPLHNNAPMKDVKVRIYVAEGQDKAAVETLPRPDGGQADVTDEDGKVWVWIRGKATGKARLKVKALSLLGDRVIAEVKPLPTVTVEKNANWTLSVTSPSIKRNGRGGVTVSATNSRHEHVDDLALTFTATQSKPNLATLSWNTATNGKTDQGVAIIDVVGSDTDVGTITVDVTATDSEQKASGTVTIIP